MKLQPCSNWPIPQAAILQAQDYPKISVITPNYNYGHSLGRTIQSVLNQGYPNLEYIVIDGGSTDNSVDVIKEYEADLSGWVSERDDGQYAAINKGMSQATGEIACWINSDDIMMPWTLFTVAHIFATFSDVSWITGRPTTLADGVIHDVSTLQPIPQELVWLGIYSSPSNMGVIQQESSFYKRSLWEHADGLRQELKLAADFDLWTRMAEHSELVAVGTVLGGFSMTSNNRSRLQIAEYNRECEQVIDSWDPHRKRDSQKTIQAIRRQSRINHLPLIRKFHRYANGLHNYAGPILRWDFNKQCYQKGYQSLPF